MRLLGASMKGNSLEIKLPWWPTYLDRRLEGGWAKHSSLSVQDLIFSFFEKLSAKDRSQVGRGLGQWYRASISEELQFKSWHSSMPFLLVSGHGRFPFSLWILLVETCFQPGMRISWEETSWCLMSGEWVQTAFPVKGALITVGSRTGLGLQIRKCNTNGSPKQGTKCLHDFSEGLLSGWQGPGMEGGMGVWLGCVNHCYTV